MLHVKVGDVFKIKEGDEAIIRNIEKHVWGFNLFALTGSKDTSITKSLSIV